VKVGNSSYIGAASCITDDVPDDSLAIGRARQTIKDGWVREKRSSAKRT
jgi:bifunctional UDP-N-acetylglucosamine pyrophosphorylase / glucosamine-1-phosphate N-acetyltransferase